MNTAPQSGWDFLNNMNGDNLTTIVFLLMLFVFVAIVIIAMTIQRMHKARLDHTLKREMVERGFSVDEIVRVIEASGSEAGLRKNEGRQAAPKETNHVLG